ncbi:MAG TPA: MFS transporter, partial [Fimbriimonadaceae bacterium]|nr:MFS transporter [Fimbriimonadaceae bacterium]
PKIMPVRSDTHEVHPFTDFLDGMRYVRRRHDLSMLILLITVFRFCVAPFFVAYVVANNLWWGGPKHQGTPQTLALIELVFFSGMVITSFAMGRVTVRQPAKWFIWGLAWVGLTVAFMAWSPQVWLFCLWNLLAGLGLPAADIPINTYCQLSVEDAFRGRTNSVLAMIANTSGVMGNALGGAFVARFGLSNAFLAMGVGMALACLAGLIDPKFREIRMPS